MLNKYTGPGWLSARQPILAQMLHALVDGHINKLIAANETFTAYSITKILRANLPSYEIVHEEVRQRVHFYMQSKSEYTSSQENWNGEIATTYSPVVTVSAPHAQQVSAPAQKLLPGQLLVTWDED